MYGFVCRTACFLKRCQKNRRTLKTRWGTKDDKSLSPTSKADPSMLRTCSRFCGTYRYRARWAVRAAIIRYGDMQGPDQHLRPAATPATSPLHMRSGRASSDMAAAESMTQAQINPDASWRRDMQGMIVADAPTTATNKEDIEINDVETPVINEATKEPEADLRKQNAATNQLLAKVIAHDQRPRPSSVAGSKSRRVRAAMRAAHRTPRRVGRERAAHPGADGRGGAGRGRAAGEEPPAGAAGRRLARREFSARSTTRRSATCRSCNRISRATRIVSRHVGSNMSTCETTQGSARRRSSGASKTRLSRRARRRS